MTFLIVRDLKIIKHKINEYVIILIYIYDKDDVIDEKIWACFIKEVHIIDDLKINILIENDIDGSKDIIVFIENCIAHINSCDVIISLKIKIIETVVAKSIHLRKIIVISSKIEFSVEIHHLIVSNKKYLFESEEIFNLIVYAHLIDAFIKTILLCNEFDISMQVSRNYRLRRITEMNYFNVFHIFTDDKNEDKIRDLIAKWSRSFKQKNWFKTIMIEIIIIFVAIALTSLQKFFANMNNSIEILKTMLFNEVIIYNLDDTSTMKNLS